MHSKNVFSFLQNSSKCVAVEGVSTSSLATCEYPG